MSDITISQDKSPWYQWDTGLTVTVAVSGDGMTECHFANRKQGTAYVQAVIKGKAKVPDELLQVAAPITAYGYIPDGAGGQTYIEQVFEVTARNIPADYTYTKTAQKTIRDAERARDQAFAAVDHVHDVADQVVGLKNDAKASADAAKKSADSAEYQKGEAKKYADDAGVAMANAQSFATQASSNATAAEWAKNHAKTSETNAAASASEAATSAQEAKTAAGNAASEVLAATKANADAAAKSATDAATAKAGAETAASNAAASAGAAADSAAAAAKSAGDAAASVGAINVIAPKTVSISASYEGTGINGVSIGAGAEAKNDAISVGYRAKTIGQQNTGVGRDTLVKGYKNTALGYNTDVSSHDAIAIGADSVASKAFEFSVGKPATDSADELTREITHVSAPSAPSSASTKKYTDDNDSKTLTEAKKYTDDNTTNALIGKVSGKLVHVEDAWPGKPIRLTIDGAYKQDGTPSPENPVPIIVIENPVLRVTGRNLVDLPDMTVLANDHNAVLFDCGLIPNGVTAYLSMVSSNDAVSKFDDAATAGLSDGKNFVYSIMPNNVTKGINKTTLTPTFDATKHLRFFGYRQASPSFDISNYQLEVGGYHDYKPYTSQSIAFILPAEHPYLAKLPDGTADTIEVDKDGNVTLVARVSEAVINTSHLQNWGKGKIIYNFPRDGRHSTGNIFISGNAVFSQMLKGISATDIYTTGSVGISVGASSAHANQCDTVVCVGDDASISSIDGMSFYYPLMTPVTYNLGKLNIPALPETISNVWTDAELTPQISMTYHKDINAVIANLNAQIAALKGTADDSTLPDQTIE